VRWRVGEDGVLTRGPQASAVEGGGVVVARVSWAERVHGLGRLDREGKGIQPGSGFGKLEIKINKLGARGRFRV
jgi:hypothetical protein